MSSLKSLLKSMKTTFILQDTIDYITAVEAAGGWVPSRYTVDDAIREAVAIDAYDSMAFWTNEDFGRDFFFE